MKTYICNPFNKQELLHHLSKDDGFIQGIETLTLSQALKEPKDSTHHFIFLLRKQLLENKEKFPIYHEMFQYHAFLEEILSFAREVILYEVDQETLPTSTPSQKELEEILLLACELPFKEKEMIRNKDVHIKQLKERDYEIISYFTKDIYHTRILKELNGFTNNEEVSIKKSLRYITSEREEIEAIAQDICTHKQSANIILTSYSSQQPVVQEVFNRYQIPYSLIQDAPALHIQDILVALLQFAIRPSLDTYLAVLEKDGFSTPIDSSLLPFLSQTITDPFVLPSMHEAYEDTIFSKEGDKYKQLEERYASFYQAIAEEMNLLKNTSSPQEAILNAYQVLQKSPYLQYENELKCGYQIYQLLKDVLKDIDDEEDLDILCHMISNISLSDCLYQTDYCVITDLSHPVSTRDYTYVVGCSSKTYPGFSVHNGLFDETYLEACQNYPSFKERYSSYKKQLSWITHSAREELIYSYHTNDYQGRSIQLSFDIASQFDKARTKWPLKRMKPYQPHEHVLQPDVAHDLFLNKEKIYGSISTIERFFACPYAYFIQSGLKVRDYSLSTLDVASFGTLQHAIMEKAYLLKKEKYAEITKEEIEQLLQKEFNALEESHPNDVHLFKLSKERMMHNLEQSIAFLQEFEKNTDFKQIEAEYKFMHEIVPNVVIRGVIDRLDAYNDFIRVMDYKSSDMKLSQTLFFAGLKLQLLTYLSLIAKEYDKKPAGAYYISLKNASFKDIAAKTSGRGKNRDVEDTIHSPEYDQTQLINNRRLNGMTMQGYPFSEEENAFIVSYKKENDFSKVEDYLKKLYKYFYDQVMEGNIEVNPTENACTFCDYMSVCKFKGLRRKEEAVFEDVPTLQVKQEK